MSVRSNLNSSIPTVNFSLITLPSFIISNTDRLFGKALLGLWWLAGIVYLSSWMVVLSLAVEQIQKLKTKLLMYNKDYKGKNL